MTKKKLFSIWVFLMIAVYIFYQARSLESSEYGIALIVVLSILSAPLGLLVPVFWSFIGPYIQGAGSGSFWGFSLIIFLSFILIGYVQWLIIVPWFIRCLKLYKLKKSK